MSPWFSNTGLNGTPPNRRGRSPCLAPKVQDGQDGIGDLSVPFGTHFLSLRLDVHGWRHGWQQGLVEDSLTVTG